MPKYFGFIEWYRNNSPPDVRETCLPIVFPSATFHNCKFTLNVKFSLPTVAVEHSTLKLSQSNKRNKFQVWFFFWFCFEFFLSIASCCHRSRIVPSRRVSPLNRIFAMFRRHIIKAIILGLAISLTQLVTTESLNNGRHLPQFDG